MSYNPIAHLGALLGALIVGVPVAHAELGHSENAVYRAVVSEGISVGGKTVKLPKPTFGDGQTDEQQMKILAELAGSERAAEAMVRDSITAPHILRLHDVAAEGATIRGGDAWFVIRADLDRIDPAETFRRTSTTPVEAGNMRFEGRILAADDLKSTGVEMSGKDEWYAHSKGRLLDRIVVESTSRIVASRSADSLVIAARTDPQFDRDARWPNMWATLKQQGDKDVAGPPQPFAGGVGYVKITRLKSGPKALIVETHFAFCEPRDWFQGKPILRSKLGLITEDQVRRLRRELAKSRG
jgi:hypothetical protein